MCNFDDDFGDDGFDDEGFMDEDESDEFMDEPEDLDHPLTNEGPEPDEFTTRDAFFVGSIVGNAYEEGLDERKRRELMRKKPLKKDSNPD